MRYLMLTVVVLVLLGLAGCGSGGGGNNNEGGTGRVTGTLAAANPASYRIVVDGDELALTPDADGSFAIPDLPPGSHTIGFISGSGMVGAYITVDINPGDTTDIGDVTPVAGGQIVGLVNQLGDDGVTLTPLAGVEVLADPEPIYYYEGADASLAQATARDGEAVTLKAITDSNGSYVIPAVPEGDYVVTVNVPGLVQGVAYVWVSPGSTAVADFQLVSVIEEGIGTIAGHVTAALEAGGSEALGGALVTVYSDGPWRPILPTDPIALSAGVRALGVAPPGADGIIAPPYYFSDFSTLTAKDGSYSLNVPSGHLQIGVWAEGYNYVFDTATLLPDATLTKDYELTPWTDWPLDDPTTGTEAK